ncbi:DUF2062 domain-containing protein [Hymenobacter crusticola]|uniref:DUF2062 domain-containing protein n=1 Tax=Hymenobacter crusticola TaxID=1770526 RepID=UPI0015C4F644|nr:DUF2062 domain-containing protein [Hymenobacter crusticola]
MSLPPASPASSSGPVAWLRRRVVDPLLHLLKQGLSPSQLALTVALGVVFGLVPFLGGTTFLVTITAVRLRLNVAAMLLVSHLLSPVQLLLIIPLLRLGARLFGQGPAPDLTMAKLRHLLEHDLGGAFSLLWRAELGALLLWALGSVVLAGLLYLGLRPVFKRIIARQAA